MKTHTTNALKLAVAFSASIIITSHAGAASIGYWQLDGTASDAVGSVNSEVNNADFTSSITTGFDGAGTVPVYSSTTPGSVIYDGIGGAVVNPNNTTSIQFVKGATSSTGSFLQINDGASGLFEPSGAFTIEAFVQSTGSDVFAAIFNKEQFATTSSAGLSTDFTQTRFRLAGAGDRTNPVDTNSTGSGFLDNGVWHHIAVVYDGAGLMTLYYDYGSLTTLAADPTANWQSGSPLSIAGVTGNVGSGNALFTGLVDELRFSDEALAPSQFLVTIPEESTTATLVGLLALAAVYIRRRRS